jgi:hypothetical protein
MSWRLRFYERRGIIDERWRASGVEVDHVRLRRD